MPRLPHPGGDAGNWGQILNDYLSAAHNSDGSLKPDAVTPSTIQDNSIPESKLDSTVQSKLNSGGGTPGATGPVGATGATGPQGTQGASGVAGSQGATGATGATGSQGPAGASGTPGTQGASGTPGVTGATGPQGPAGTDGNDGAAGATGATGATGPAGTDGQDGTSVTIAGSVANAAALPTGLDTSDAGQGYLTNNDGHLHVWSGSVWTDVGEIRGPQGATGAAGLQGATGPTGTTGSTGATGATGPTGSQGAQGATGAVGATGAPGATTIAGISGLQGALDGKRERTSATIEINGADAYLEDVRITNDASDTATWPERLTFRYRDSSSGTYYRTGYFNEYGEIRVASAKSNTVALRAFTREYTTQTAHSPTVPIIEMMDDRTNRNRLFAVMPDGTVTAPNIGNKVTASATAPSSPAVGDVWIDLSV